VLPIAFPQEIVEVLWDRQTTHGEENRARVVSGTPAGMEASLPGDPEKALRGRLVRSCSELRVNLQGILRRETAKVPPP